MSKKKNNEEHYKKHVEDEDWSRKIKIKEEKKLRSLRKNKGTFD